MPNRIIKESICYSDDIDKLTAFEETVFYRMIVRADDYGRLDARPSFLKSMLFVTKQGITEKNVQDAVLKMASVGLVRLYEVDGKPFLSFPKWDLHQRVRNSKEKYPAPPENTDCGVSPQLAANCGELPRVAALIQSESNPNPIRIRIRIRKRAFRARRASRHRPLKRLRPIVLSEKTTLTPSGLWIFTPLRAGWWEKTE